MVDLRLKCRSRIAYYNTNACTRNRLTFSRQATETLVTSSAMAPGTPGPDLPGVWSNDQVRESVEQISSVAKHAKLVPFDDGRCEGVVECCQAAGCFHFALEQPCKHDSAP